jgi:hypothetical protein
MGGGKSGGGSSTSTVRFAPYIETHHENFLTEIQTRVDSVIDSSPFTGYTDIDFETAFFGVGYVLSDFPSLYDMFGKFMAGLDIEVLWNQLFVDTTTGPEVDALVAAQALVLSDDLENTAYPRYITGMRDLNAVMSSTFVIGKAKMEIKRQQELSRFTADLKYKLIQTANDRWTTHLNWNKNVVTNYAEIIKFYLMSAIDVGNHNYEMATKDLLWPFTVLEYQRAALGALTGAHDTNTDVAGASKGAKVLGGALSGAAAGGMIGGAMAGATTGSTLGVPGAIIGGILGAAYGLLS